jgi:hypothetical protein
MSSGGAEVANPEEASVAGFTVVLPRLAPSGTRVVLTLVDQRAGEPTGIRVYWGSSRIGAQATLADFLASGGVMLNEHQPDGRDAPTIAATVGKRAMPVAVASFEGVLIHGDEVKPGVRSYGLYWSDGKREFSLLGVPDPAPIIDLARSIYCP